MKTNPEQLDKLEKEVSKNTFNYLNKKNTEFTGTKSVVNDALHKTFGEDIHQDNLKDNFNEAEVKKINKIIDSGIQKGIERKK